MKNSVLILISTYNGEKYLKYQLESLYKQKNVALDILIRDDGSKDGTIELIKNEMSNHDNIKFYSGENLGYAYSFWNLIKEASLEYDYYAFCDQDDIWDDNKIIKAINLINKNYEDDDVPMLYTSNVKSMNNDGNILSNNTFNTYGKLNLYESYQKSAFPGCVFVFNKSAIMYLKKYDGFMESHDWAAYAIINTMGKVIFDSNSYINYRIHEGNTIGKENNIKVFKKKIKNFFSKRKNTRSKMAKDILETYKTDIPEMYYENIKMLAYYRINFKLKLKLLFSRKFKGFIFKIYVLLNRI